MQARTNAARRRCRESAASQGRSEVQPSADLSWREALGLLHEELDRLPDKYRLPLLLCYLDGKSREEAAQFLGCSLGCVKGRLERGRELLRVRLIRRGVTLSGALLAALVDAPAATSAAPVLVRATLNAALTGSYRPSLAVLMQSAAPALWSGKVRMAMMLLLTISLLAVGGGRSEPRRPANPRAKLAEGCGSAATAGQTGCESGGPCSRTSRRSRAIWPSIPA